MEAVRHFILLALLFLVVQSPLAYSDWSVAVVVPQQKYPYSAVANAIEKAFQQSPNVIQTDVLPLSKSLSPERLKKYDLLIPLGYQASKQLMAHNPTQPVISSFVTRGAINALLDHTHHDRLQAIHIEQPTKRILKLLQELPFKANKIGAINSHLTKTTYEELALQAREFDIQVTHQQLSAEQNPIKQISRIMEHSEAFLVLPGKAEFNRRIAKWVLYLSYRYKLPVIAYSKKYADAGALISLFSTPKQLGRQTGELAIATLSGSTATKTIHAPKYFSLEINDTVRRSLDLPPLDRNQLLQRIRHPIERPPRND